MDDYDDIPIKLPSGRKALVRLPRPFDLKDARHLVKFIANYVEDKDSAAAAIGKQGE